MRVPRVVRNTLLSALVMVVLFAAGGVLYVKYADGQTKAPAPKPQVTAADYQPLPKPPKPAADSPEGVALNALDSPVSPDDNTSITIQTQPTSKCTISVNYGKLAAKDSGLSPKIADEYGIVTWSWTVDPAAPAGTWPVKVICAYGSKWAQYIGQLQVQ